jgi:hypothetical protein
MEGVDSEASGWLRHSFDECCIDGTNTMLGGRIVAGQYSTTVQDPDRHANRCQAVKLP